ncbi:Fic family protein [Chitinophaga niastensis]|uniref:Fic family protein n=1 Tax=Chitinophaga niastensis TaxID=536980 RepID=A0A2P8HNR5_CHINA|nr:Fic family protein [Chitinophaga niastensis]PSL47860.1 Fic family protein [Chitinophaga niastensis]
MAHNNIPYNDLPALPPAADLNTIPILTNLARASRHLGELNGLCASLPDPHMLINTIALQESKDSSAIENIVTTQDELYKAASEEETTTNHAAKEVLNYRQALYAGLEKMQSQQHLILTNTLIDIVRTIKQNNAGIRNTPGTAIKNAITGATVYTPPSGEDVIREKMSSLELFINDRDLSPLDPLIKMALIHYQFEAIHPFSDGNGRTGRILNGLYLVQQHILPQPILYLSAYIVKHRSTYYQLLQGVTEQNNWNDWVMFMLTALSETAQMTTEKIRLILFLMSQIEQSMRVTLGNSFNYELLKLIFSLPYLKVETLVDKKIGHRQTAAAWLKKLVEKDVLRAHKIGKTTYYVNHALIALLSA